MVLIKRCVNLVVKSQEVISVKSRGTDRRAEGPTGGKGADMGAVGKGDRGTRGGSMGRSRGGRGIGKGKAEGTPRGRCFTWNCKTTLFI